MPTPKGPWTLPAVATGKLAQSNYFYDEFDPPGRPAASMRNGTLQVIATEMLRKQEEGAYSQMDATQLRVLLDALNSQPTLPVKLSLNDARDRTSMICMRMRCTLAEFPFQHYTTIYANDKVYVTIVLRNEAVMLTDDASIFPSDTLVAQLVLLRE